MADPQVLWRKLAIQAQVRPYQGGTEVYDDVLEDQFDLAGDWGDEAVVSLVLHRRELLARGIEAGKQAAFAELRRLIGARGDVDAV